MSKYKKGESGNPAGRPAGIKNTKSLLWEELSDKFTNQYAENITDYMDQLWRTDKDKFFEVYKSLLNYFKPKLANTSIDLDGRMNINASPSWFGLPLGDEKENID